jgi:hypothetical protein
VLRVALRSLLFAVSALMSVVSLFLLWGSTLEQMGSLMDEELDGADFEPDFQLEGDGP